MNDSILRQDMRSPAQATAFRAEPWCYLGSDLVPTALRAVRKGALSFAVASHERNSIHALRHLMGRSGS